jgi:hypothetical protein
MNSAQRASDKEASCARPGFSSARGMSSTRRKCTNPQQARSENDDDANLRADYRALGELIRSAANPAEFLRKEARYLSHR